MLLRGVRCVGGHRLSVSLHAPHELVDTLTTRLDLRPLICSHTIRRLVDAAF
jgi:hypothetical protein